MGDSLLHATHIVWKRPVRKIAPRYGYNIQRQGARVCLRSGALATLQFWEVTLLNLSRSGVLLEHFHQVRVGGQYQLTFPVEDRRITVIARVARSSVSHFTEVDGGEKRTVYRTGLEFTRLTENMAQQISGFIDRLRAADLTSWCPSTDSPAKEIAEHAPVPLFGGVNDLKSSSFLR